MKDINVAVVQYAPVLFDINKTIDRVERLVQLAKEKSPDLVLFPEAFIPAYPRGLTFGTVVGSRSEKGKEVWQKYHDNSLKLNGGLFVRLKSIAKKAKIFLVIGVIEKVASGTLYCTILYINKEGELVGKHRKLKPTAAERIIWGDGDGKDLDVYQTELGRIGGLVCWENYMPLARTWLYQNNIEIYLAPTADHRDSWQHTVKHIATEGRCFVLSCNQFVTKSDYPSDLPIEELSGFDEIMTRGGSIIIDPLGNTLAGPLFDESGILHAKLSADLLVRSKMDFDPVGHYSRDDVFRLEKLT